MSSIQFHQSDILRLRALSSDVRIREIHKAVIDTTAPEMPLLHLVGLPQFQ